MLQYSPAPTSRGRSTARRNPSPADASRRLVGSLDPRNPPSRFDDTIAYATPDKATTACFVRPGLLYCCPACHDLEVAIDALCLAASIGQPTSSLCFDPAALSSPPSCGASIVLRLLCFDHDVDSVRHNFALSVIRSVWETWAWQHSGWTIPTASSTAQHTCDCTLTSATCYRRIHRGH